MPRGNHYPEVVHCPGLCEQALRSQIHNNVPSKVGLLEVSNALALNLFEAINHNLAPGPADDSFSDRQPDTATWVSTGVLKYGYEK